MSKKVFFKEGDRLYTPYEAKKMNINTRKYTVKKVYRSVDEITDTQYFGRLDRTADANSWFVPSVNEISTKQLRNRKVAKQMTALGLLV